MKRRKRTRSKNPPARSSLNFVRIVRKRCHAEQPIYECPNLYSWTCDKCPVVVMFEQEKELSRKTMDEITCIPVYAKWECPICGQLENKEVTFFEQCTFCGADVT